MAILQFMSPHKHLWNELHQGIPCRVFFLSFFLCLWLIGPICTVGCYPMIKTFFFSQFPHGPIFVFRFKLTWFLFSSTCIHALIEPLCFFCFSLVDNYLNCFKHEFQTIALNCASSEMQDFLVFTSLMWEKRESWQGHLLTVRIFSENPTQNPKLLKKRKRGRERKEEKKQLRV